MNDIRTKADVKIFVDAFYREVRKDALLGPVFAEKIADARWGMHLERMYSFWNTVLFAERDYRGNPFAKHASLPIQAAHFEQWIALLSNTVDGLFVGEKTEEVKWRAIKMGQIFQSKLEYIRQNDSFKNIM